MKKKIMLIQNICLNISLLFNGQHGVVNLH